MSIWISLQTLFLLPLSVLLSMDGLLHWTDPPQSQLVLLGLVLLPSIPFSAYPSPVAVPMPTIYSTSGTPASAVAHFFLSEFVLLSFKLHFDSPQAILSTSTIYMSHSE
jgi:hypothetical protein